MALQIYHNPRCSKSRQTLALLEETGKEIEIILYLETPPSPKELQAILQKLGKPVRDIIRKGEKLYKELELSDQDLSTDALLTALNANPILIERPIVVSGDQARIGRPPEAVLEIIKD